MAQHRIGMTHLAMRVSWPGMPQADILASLELIGTEVLPEVRRRIAACENRSRPAYVTPICIASRISAAISILA